MRKIILIFTLLLTTFLFSQAQFKQIAEGPKFTEHEEGFAKILNMKNGNTVYLNISLKEGINIRLYDPAHTQTLVTTVYPAYQTLKTGDIEAIFEIANDVVIFISERDDRTPVLYRMVIDGSTGKLKEEKTVARMRKEGAFVNTSRYKSFYVSKDPYTDNYAVILYSVMESDIEKRMEIIHYGSNNNEISRGFFASADKDNRFFFYINMVVMGSNKVCAFLFASEDKYEIVKKGNMVLATLQKGAVAYTTLNAVDEVKVQWGLAKYNPVTKKILFLTAARLAKTKSTFMNYQPAGKRLYEPYLIIVDPVSNSISSDGNIGGSEKLYTYYKEQFDKKDDYAGMPQNLFINDDGGFAIVYEEIMVQRQSSQSGFGASSTIRVDTKLGKLVVATYDQNGTLVSNYLVPKEHWVIFQELAPFYHARREGSAQQLFRGNQYKSFAYLNGINKNYILFNDTERNNEVKKDKFVEVQGVSDCDAFMYKLTGSDVAPKREYAFGAPAAKGHILALYAISDYDRNKNVYATLRLDKESPTNKEVKLVWLQPQ